MVEAAEADSTEVLLTTDDIRTEVANTIMMELGLEIDDVVNGGATAGSTESNHVINNLYHERANANPTGSTLITDDIMEEVATADSRESIPPMYEDRQMDIESIGDVMFENEDAELNSHDYDNTYTSAGPTDEYLLVITNVVDHDNMAYESLLSKDDRVRDLIHISDIFDFEEDNDEIGDDNDPLFDGTLKSQEVALEDLNPNIGEIQPGDETSHTKSSIGGHREAAM